MTCRAAFECEAFILTPDAERTAPKARKIGPSGQKKNSCLIITRGWPPIERS